MKENPIRDEINKKLKTLKKDKKPIITLRDAVLMLLYAQKDVPIYSRISLFKEVFLLYEEILKKYSEQYFIQDPKFESYKYGPYSFDLAEVLEQLHWSGYIEISGRRNSRVESFKITPKGEKEIREKFENLPAEVREKIIQMRKGWDQLGVDGILRYVYQKYSNYKSKSRLKDKYREIMWGGRG